MRTFRIFCVNCLLLPAARGAESAYHSGIGNERCPRRSPKTTSVASADRGTGDGQTILRSGFARLLRVWRDNEDAALWTDSGTSIAYLYKIGTLGVAIIPLSTKAALHLFFFGFLETLPLLPR